MTIFRAGGGRLFLLVRCNVKHFSWKLLRRNKSLK